MASARPEVYAGYHFIVLDEPGRVNAYAVPGGFIFITTGLIAKTASENELAEILATRDTPHCFRAPCRLYPNAIQEPAQER